MALPALATERRDVDAPPAEPESDGDNPPDELLDAAADATPAGGESFATLAPRGGSADSAPSPLVSDAAAPSVASAAAHLPASTHELLDELFKAKITTVRRISREQLR